MQVYPDGSTAPGWGETQFMAKYQANAFSARRAEVIYERHQTPFALVMRSMAMVCIDIDGKNGGIEEAEKMLLPITLAETSKSGNGYHLFYTVPGLWDTTTGFAAVRDKINFRPGVDIRGVGCVYHHPQQQWNLHDPVPLPQLFLDELQKRTYDLAASLERIEKLVKSTDPDDEQELLVMQDTIQSKLTAPIPTGRRNNTLFAIGAEMAQAQVPGWEKQVYDRGIELGLSDEEMTKLVSNVRKYG